MARCSPCLEAGLDWLIMLPVAAAPFCSTGYILVQQEERAGQ